MIRLPWPPTVNHYYTVARNRKILSKQGRAYKQEAAWLIASERHYTVQKGRICLTIHAHPPDKRKRDLDNILKPILDSLTEAGVFEDDSQVDDLRITRFPPQNGGYVEIIVSSYES